MTGTCLEVTSNRDRAETAAHEDLMRLLTWGRVDGSDTHSRSVGHSDLHRNGLLVGNADSPIATARPTQPEHVLARLAASRHTRASGRRGRGTTIRPVHEARLLASAQLPSGPRLARWARPRRVLRRP